MALLTVSTETALTKAGNSVLTASVFHGLAANLGFCMYVLHITRHSTLTRLALARKRKIVIVSAEFCGKQSHEVGPWSVVHLAYTEIYTNLHKAWNNSSLLFKNSGMWLANAKQKLTVSAEQESLRARKIASTKPANTFAFVFKNPTQQSGEFHMVLSSRFMNLIFIIINIFWLQQIQVYQKAQQKLNDNTTNQSK